MNDLLYIEGVDAVEADVSGVYHEICACIDSDDYEWCTCC